MTVEAISPTTALRAEADRFLASGALSRSDVMLRLFNFLLDRSLAGNVPKELEVALEVFDKDAEFDAMQDASVRVYVYRLRKKLDEYYAASPAERRLFIPRGEYRLALADADEIPPLPPEEEAEELAVPSARRPRRRTLVAGVAALLVLLAIAGLILFDRRNADPAVAAAREAPWSTFDARFPTYVVLGDYYIFGEAGPDGQIARLVREFSVNSREDLDAYLMLNPDMMGRYVNLDLNYLPVAAAPALHAIEPLARAAGRSDAGPLRVVTASSLAATTIRGANIVYVGYLSGLGILAGPALGASQFRIGASYDELIDRKTGKTYLSDWSRVMDARTPTRDYGYIASIPGPSGTRVVIVAGTRDAGLVQAAEIAANPDELRRIAGATKGAEAFEALYEVQTLGSTNLGSRLIAAYPLRRNNVWGNVREAQDALPDARPQAGGE